LKSGDGRTKELEEGQGQRGNGVGGKEKGRETSREKRGNSVLVMGG